MNTFDEEYQRKVAEGLMESGSLAVEATRVVNEGVVEGDNKPSPANQEVVLPLPEPEQRPLASGLSETELKAQGIPTYYGRLVQKERGQTVTRDFPPCHVVEYKEYSDGSGIEVTLVGTGVRFLLDKPGDIFYAMVREGTGWRNNNVKSFDRYTEELREAEGGEEERDRRKKRKRKDLEEKEDRSTGSNFKSVKRRT